MDEEPVSDKISQDTLRILHLPPHLTRAQRETLLKKFGAIRVRTIHKSAKYTITFAKFPSKQAADRAFLRLHQLEVRGRRLSVEYAKTSMLPDRSDGDVVACPQDQEEDEDEPPDKQHFQAFLKRLNGWGFSQTLSQPPHPNIRYKYSPPTRITLMRIAIQLIKEPAFYYQVLHLMNKMNLPPPFEELDDEFPLLKEIYDITKFRNIFGTTCAEADQKSDEQSEEEEESELETDDDAETRPEEVIPAKRKRPQSTKRLKIPKFVNPSKQPIPVPGSSQKVVKPEDVFDSVQRGESKTLKIALKDDLTDRLDSRQEAPMDVEPALPKETGFGLIYPEKKPQALTSTEEKAKEPHPEFITTQELTSNRISANDQRLLPVFKNYHPGKASCRLYIKNLAKQVEAKDLRFIYERYLPLSGDQSESQFNVRLMQEGRMKGQAFVTFGTTEQAQLALDETNGYILKDKPMVVQFAKAANKPQTK